MKKVLIIDDEREFHITWKDDLDYMGIESISAFTLQEAKKKFEEEKENIGLIVMDACLIPGEGPTTLELTKQFRKQFAGPIMANSSEKHYQKLLLEAGCNCIGDKSIDLPYAIEKIIKA